MLVTQNELPYFQFILRLKKKHEKFCFQSILKYILLLRKRNGKKGTKKIRNVTKRNDIVRETKRNGTKKILKILKRNETKRYNLGNETKRNDKKITFSNPCFFNITLVPAIRIGHMNARLKGFSVSIILGFGSWSSAPVAYSPIQPKFQYTTSWYSIDQKFYVDDE
jgi:hypothetical protein